MHEELPSPTTLPLGRGEGGLVPSPGLFFPVGVAALVRGGNCRRSRTYAVRDKTSPGGAIEPLLAAWAVQRTSERRGSGGGETANPSISYRNPNLPRRKPFLILIANHLHNRVTAFVRPVEQRLHYYPV